jgi:membrane peptidoglycan carboxypeptidase
MDNEGFSIRSVGGKHPQKAGARVPSAAFRPSPEQAPPSGRDRLRQQRRRAPEGNIFQRGWRWLERQKRGLSLAQLAARAGGAALLLFVLYFGYLWLTLPNVRDPYNSLFSAAQSTTITDRNGVELYRVYGEQDRKIVTGDQIAEPMKQAIVAIEDKRFFTRGCLDMRALGRLALNLGTKGGASTLTRQLARNALNLQQENIINRKLKELILGCQLEARYSKNEVLNLYLNWVPFGQNAYGVEQASRAYFGKSAKDLTLAESAVLAGLPQAPSYYSPYGRHVHTTVADTARAQILAGKITSSDGIADADFQIGLLGTTVGSGSKAVYVGGRADQVLQNMLDQKMITQAQYTQAQQDFRHLVFTPSHDALRAAHFVLWMKDQTEKLFENSSDKGLLERGGLTIQTTLDWRLQEAAEKAVAAHKADILKRFGAHNVALVALDPKTREILAYVGNVDYADTQNEGKIDMVQVPRAPGSSFKPIVYAQAFTKGYGPATVLYDVSTKFGDYQPQNYEGGFWGLTSIRKALGGSRNIPAIKAYFLAGEEKQILELAAQMGAPTPGRTEPKEGYGPSLAIGTGETPLLEMTNAYGTFADSGLAKDPVSISKVTDRNGALLYESNKNDAGQQVLDPRVAYEITSILSDPSARPGDYWRNILSVAGTQAAAKTGTSNKCLTRDAKQNCTKRKPDNVWTLGYTPSLVAGVWVGNATSDAMSDSADGINVAAPVWKDFMTAAQKILKPDVTTFAQPDGLVTAQVSQLSGELPTECTPVGFRKAELFLKENAPNLADPACVTMTVDRVTGLLPSDSCPADAQEQRSFFVPHSIVPPSANLAKQWEDGVQAWAHGQSGSGSGSGLPLPLPPTTACDISLTPGRLDPVSLTIVSPANGGSLSYPSFQPKIQFSVGSGVHLVTYAVDGKTAASFSDAPYTGTVTVPASVSKDGTHTLTVTLTDSFYNTMTATAQFSFTQDTNGPQVRFTEPSNGALMNISGTGGLLMRATASDPEGGVKYVEFYLDGTLLTRKPKEPYEIRYTDPVLPGPHLLRAVATDLTGNMSEDQIQIVVQ